MEGNRLAFGPVSDSDPLLDLLHDLEVDGPLVGLRDDEPTVHVGILSIYSNPWLSSPKFDCAPSACLCNVERLRSSTDANRNANATTICRSAATAVGVMNTPCILAQKTPNPRSRQYVRLRSRPTDAGAPGRPRRMRAASSGAAQPWRRYCASRSESLEDQVGVRGLGHPE